MGLGGVGGVGCGECRGWVKVVGGFWGGVWVIKVEKVVVVS